MNRIFALFFALTFALPLFSCAGNLEPVAPQTRDPQTKETAETKEKESVKTEETKETEEKYTPPTDSQSIQHPLDGKKFIFIGNSYTYYGKCVLEKKTTNFSQEERSHDKGYFYQIAKENGADVEVTNWTYGGHTLQDTFGGNCSADRGCDGHDHSADLTDRYYDYVMIQEGGTAKGDILENVGRITSFFRAANPNVKFCFLVHHRFYEKELTAENRKVMENLKTLEDMGITVVDWGRLVVDVHKGNTQVPGSQLSYNRHSFIISKSSSDGHHQNMLAGYITSLMTWCAITGDSAVGQEYRFTGNPTVNSAFDFMNYRSKYYTYGTVSTNFDKALKSKTEVLGFQQLIDKYLADKEYRNFV